MLFTSAATWVVRKAVARRQHRQLLACHGADSKLFPGTLVRTEGRQRVAKRNLGHIRMEAGIKARTVIPQSFVCVRIKAI